MVKQELLNILCCPKCKGSLDYKPAAKYIDMQKVRQSV